MHPSVIADLAASGLEPLDLKARLAGVPELTAVGASVTEEAYVIPYYDIQGKPLPFYRVKLINQEPKYRHPKNVGNHIYFPPNFQEALRGKSYVILTEGEKKAVAACKEGFPTVAVGGVYSWRNRTIILPEGTEFNKISGKKGGIKVKIPSTDDTISDNTNLALGTSDLIHLLISRNLTLILVFDSSVKYKGIALDVQRACAQLALEMRFHNIPVNRIKQLILPINIKNGPEKVGVDDYLVHVGEKAFKKLIDNTLKKKTGFPRYPNIASHVANKLQTKLSRKQTQALSLCILSELDARGRRIRSRLASQPYYFDGITKKLMPAGLLQKAGQPLHESTFGNFLYKEFNLTGGDTRIINWLASQFTGEEPVEEATPRRIVTLAEERPDCIAFQLSDSQFALITPDESNPIEIHDNGEVGILFEQDQVDKIDTEKLLSEFNDLRDKTIEPWWLDVFKSVNLTSNNSSSANEKKNNDVNVKRLATLLAYTTPWLNRWRGTQLPVEIIIGEAGSGKSSLYALRLNILTGRPLLRNIPQDLRDWHSSISSTGGLHVTDNVQFTNKELKQRLSDEICRITTEPQPHIEMRRLYTTATQLSMPVEITFAFTAIQQPFVNVDLMQRSIIFQIRALESSHDSDWIENQMDKFGGRERWVAHHLLVLHKYLKAVVVDGLWDPEFQATHRLAHFEQTLMVMSQVLGMDPDWISEELSSNSTTNLATQDWVLEGLSQFAIYVHDLPSDEKPREFSSGTIVDWCSEQDDFAENHQLTNARLLGRYMISHAATIHKVTGIKFKRKQGTRFLYELDPHHFG